MSWGRNINISVFGESHGPAIGVVLEGIKPGIKLDMEAVQKEMARRAPGGQFATKRREADEVKILSGIWNGCTEGTPIAAMIENTNTKSSDYESLKNTPRPAHADYGAAIKYKGFADMRGGGHFSGRLTAPLVFAGAVARQALAAKGVRIAGRLAAAGGVLDMEIGYTAAEMDTLQGLTFPVLDDMAAQKMQQCIEEARKNGDSIGGVAEVFALGVKAGIGGPLFEGVEGRIASLLFSVPGVKGVEFGGGFKLSDMRGSEANDAFCIGEAGEVKTLTNHSGGILGGITNGMPLFARVAFKPTPSIALEQQTVDLKDHSETKIAIAGRHDPCIALRGVYAAESCLALALLDLYMEA